MGYKHVFFHPTAYLFEHMISLNLKGRHLEPPISVLISLLC